MKSIQGMVAKPNSNLTQQNAQLHAQKIKSVIENLINSKYVIKDKIKFASLMQTPLRESIQDLRQIAEQLEQKQNTTRSKTCKLSNLTENKLANPKSIINELFRFVELCEFSCSMNIVCDFDDEVYVKLSRSWLTHALAEIIFNALRHNRHHKSLSILVSLSIRQDCVYLVVQDNGKGIPYTITNFILKAGLAHNKHVYTQYRQLLPENLYAIQTHLLNNQGSLEIKTARGLNTAVTLALPLAYVNTNEVGPNNVGEIPLTYVNQLKNHTESLLLVRHKNAAEDPKNQYIVDILSDAFNLTQAYSLQEGLEQFTNHIPSCIVMEVKASEGKMQMLKECLNLSPKYSLVPMVVITENLGEYRQLDALHSGINALVSKPVDYYEIIDIVKSLLKEKARMLCLIKQGIAEHHIEQYLEQDDSETLHVFKQRFNDLLAHYYHEEDFNKVKAASLLSMHEKTLSRRMKNHYEASFTEVLRRFRLGKAKEMIMDGNSITSTAYSCGFSSPSYFTQCFKIEYGFAPSLLIK